MKRSSNTIRNELRRGTVTQIIHGYQEIEMYFPDTGEKLYKRNRRNSKKKGKSEQCEPFLKFVEYEVKKGKRSFAAARAKALSQGIFKASEVVSVDTLYRYAKEGNKPKGDRSSRKSYEKNKRRKYHRANKRLRGKSI